MRKENVSEGARMSKERKMTMKEWAMTHQAFLVDF